MTIIAIPFKGTISDDITIEEKGTIVLSNPPVGGFKVRNIYIYNGKLKIEYDDGT